MRLSDAYDIKMATRQGDYISIVLAVATIASTVAAFYSVVNGYLAAALLGVTALYRGLFLAVTERKAIDRKFSIIWNEVIKRKQCPIDIENYTFIEYGINKKSINKKVEIDSEDEFKGIYKKLLEMYRDGLLGYDKEECEFIYSGYSRNPKSSHDTTGKD